MSNGTIPPDHDYPKARMPGAQIALGATLLGVGLLGECMRCLLVVLGLAQVFLGLYALDWMNRHQRLVREWLARGRATS